MQLCSFSIFHSEFTASPMSRTAGMADAAGKSGSAVTAAGRVVIIIIPRNLPPLLRGITVNIAAERQIEAAVSHIWFAVICVRTDFICERNTMHTISAATHEMSSDRPNAPPSENESSAVSSCVLSENLDSLCTGTPASPPSATCCRYHSQPETKSEKPPYQSSFPKLSRKYDSKSCWTASLKISSLSRRAHRSQNRGHPD